MPITQDNYKEFSAAYSKAFENHDLSFMFEGQEILTAYAKYVVEYMERKLNDAQVRGNERT